MYILRCGKAKTVEEAQYIKIYYHVALILRPFFLGNPLRGERRQNVIDASCRALIEFPQIRTSMPLPDFD